MTKNLLFVSSWTFETLRLGWSCLNSLISLTTELNLGSTSFRIIGTLFLWVEDFGRAGVLIEPAELALVENETKEIRLPFVSCSVYLS